MGVRLLQVTADFIVMQASCKDNSYCVATNPLPQDTKVVAIHVDPRQNNVFIMKLQSEEWTEVKEGEIIPFLPEIQWMTLGRGRYG